jgi:FlaG/FlaF family flagellin (archaellin)
MKQNTAVSPVIGSILMIVLTIIVAAVVSSFAGGMIETKQKFPTVTFEAEFASNGDLSLLHLTGDPLPLSMVTVRLTPSETFGIDAKKHSRMIDKTAFQMQKKHWGTDISVMRVGDRHYIERKDLEKTLDSAETDPAYQIINSNSDGKTFYLEIYYENSLIAKQEILIKN